MMEDYTLGWSGVEYLFPVWFPLVILLIAGIRLIRKRYFYESYCLFEKKHPSSMGKHENNSSDMCFDVIDCLCNNRFSAVTLSPTL